ncbi:hypothetical protein GCM10011512_28490 [Tersicoccus solisilvae]|uniref:Uncharacterized protein n=1 Tax=Tersicoccus solisilvae TaxID=1882339 RepID=A0ABQ1PNF9_9MICC|nr:hypothetical protein [Tersicoccus solisilvae]GGC99904.1 hypothetical protein GCM10011512_28490 [Tersicoccus solisilvae]
MSLPTPLAVILIIAGLWSLVTWGFTGFRALRAVRTTPARTAPADDETGTATAARPAAPASASSLLVVAISMTLGLATLVIGFRSLG